MKEEYQLAVLLSWQGGWESVSGNPDVYIFRVYDGKYCLLAYYYDKDYGRGSFTCYDIDSDEKGLYIGIGVKRYCLLPEKSPYGLRIGEWGSYIKN
jgi:hypothetical protein